MAESCNPTMDRAAVGKPIIAAWDQAYVITRCLVIAADVVSGKIDRVVSLLVDRLRTVGGFVTLPIRPHHETGAPHPIARDQPRRMMLELSPC